MRMLLVLLWQVISAGTYVYRSSPTGRASWPSLILPDNRMRVEPESNSKQRLNNPVPVSGTGQDRINLEELLIPSTSVRITLFGGISKFSKYIYWRFFSPGQRHTLQMPTHLCQNSVADSGYRSRWSWIYKFKNQKWVWIKMTENRLLETLAGAETEKLFFSKGCAGLSPSTWWQTADVKWRTFLIINIPVRWFRQIKKTIFLRQMLDFIARNHWEPIKL